MKFILLCVQSKCSFVSICEYIYVLSTIKDFKKYEMFVT